ncbi:hypothetical protein FQP88_14340 [Vibrio atlanticus]|nr:hypothetical protein FQP88_14340 [Vibrio atlanticus]
MLDFSLLMVVLFIIFSSMSRSGLLGILFFLPVLLNANRSSKNWYIKMLVLSCVVFGLSTYMFVTFSTSNFGEHELITNTFNRIESTDTESQVDIRGYNLLYDFPEYLITGAGQGAEYRFERTHEIHSSWAAIIFYYGIPGTIMFVIFIMKIMNKMPIFNRVYFMAPFLYGISTYGLRTPIFWIMISVIASIYMNEVNEDESK